SSGARGAATAERVATGPVQPVLVQGDARRQGHRADQPHRARAARGEPPAALDQSSERKAVEGPDRGDAQQARSQGFRSPLSPQLLSRAARWWPPARPGRGSKVNVAATPASELKPFGRRATPWPRQGYRARPGLAGAAAG